MLFKNEQLQNIKLGKVTLTFRKWRKPTVKKGTIVRTAVGLIKIADINMCTLNDITETEAKKAGHENLLQLHHYLQNIKAGNLYRITLQYHAPDPLLTLRSKTDLTPAETEALKNTLLKMDKNAKHGPWTVKILQIIERYPETPAGDLASLLNMEKEWFKTHVRKLKYLGLTISCDYGYKLSDRGALTLQEMTRQQT